jgi:hypothetical protein
MRFPLLWPTWKVALLALLWLALVFGVALGLTVRNVGPVLMANETVVGLSLFREVWPPWVPVLGWVPAVGMILWRVLLPPVASPPADDAA